LRIPVAEERSYSIVDIDVDRQHDDDQHKDSYIHRVLLVVDLAGQGWSRRIAHLPERILS
jgi:hypothetical protein